MKNYRSSLILCACILLAGSGQLFAGGLFLNGVDISSARNQTLKNVNISISEDGTVFIEAPHYQVREDDIFTSLGKTYKGRFVDEKHARVGHKGKNHPNSKIDPSNLPTYKEFQDLSSKDLKARKKLEQEDELSSLKEDKIARKIDTKELHQDEISQDSLAKDSLQEEKDNLGSVAQEENEVKTDKRSRKNSGNLLRRDQREELSR